MSRPLPWFWIALAAVLLLLPMPVGRFLLDLLGGLTLTLLLLPLLAGAAAWIGWQILRSRLRPCPVCGVTSLSTDSCPACGASMQGVGVDAPGYTNATAEIDVSQVTINVEAVEVEAKESGGESSRSSG
jgi:hypothetical protein